MVTHKQVYFPLMGGIQNTTLCGRVQNYLSNGFNVGESISCKFCLKILNNPKHWSYQRMITYSVTVDGIKKYK